MARVAVIDLGTVTERLAIADVCSSAARLLEKQSKIVNVGEGVDKTRLITTDAIMRAVDTAKAYMERIKESAVDAVCCTMTSAARDAKNSHELIKRFKELGLAPQVIPGELEGSLTFLGVAQDFVDTRIMVADNGGGSTELAVGSLSNCALNIEWVHSVDVGCRRITDRFLSHTDPPSEQDLAFAHAFAAEEFMRAIEAGPVKDVLPKTLVVTGGTATTAVAIDLALEPYDPSRVHLAHMSAQRFSAVEKRLARVECKQRANITGIQPQRAGVILGGTVALSELMQIVGVDEMIVSESDLLVGLSLVCASCVDGTTNPLAWTPLLS